MQQCYITQFQSYCLPLNCTLFLTSAHACEGWSRWVRRVRGKGWNLRGPGEAVAGGHHDLELIEEGDEAVVVGDQII